MGCPLCKTREDRGVQFVTEQGSAFAMVSYEPLKDPHVMILPNRCVPDMGQLSPEEARDWTALCNKVMCALDENMEQTPMLLVNGSGFRTQPQHLHAHVVPSNVDFRGLYEAAEQVPPRTRQPEAVLQDMANRVQALLDPDTA